MAVTNFLANAVVEIPTSTVTPTALLIATMDVRAIPTKPKQDSVVAA